MLSDANTQTFWDHLDVLRSCLWRIIVVLVVSSIIAFFFKDALFSLVLAPTHGDFLVYRWLQAPPFELRLVNTGLTEQMIIHMKVATYAGLVVSSPYIIYVIFGFVSPALYTNERRYSLRIISAAYVMFFLGTIVNYLLIFPLTVRFLGNYQVSGDVANMVTLTSYVDALVLLSLGLGIVFELPIVAFLLARFGLLRAAWMRHYRRHAIVATLIAAAFITPTTDVFTLIIVSLPIYILYECSIFIVAHNQKPTTPQTT